MKNTHLAVAIALGLLATADTAFSQNRPAPTGQVPKSYSNQQQGTSSYSGYQPRPTGQIAPAAPGQSPANLPRPATSNQVQNLGFEAAKGDITAEGQVPKVNSSQDPRTFPERYQSTTTAPVEQTITVQGSQVLPAQNGQQVIPGQTTQTSVTTQTTADQTTQPAADQQSGQPVQSTQRVPASTQPVQKSPSQISSQPQTQAPAPGAPKRMEP